MLELRDYQIEVHDKAVEIIKSHGFCYLSMQVRIGKTLTALSIMKTMSVNRLLFITKKKAIPSITSDYELLGPKYELVIMNYESIHKIPNRFFDGIVVDEAHCLGAFPKPSNRARQVRALIKENPTCKVVLMSGTPTPESYTQMYHQVYYLPNNPFNNFSGFYSFSRVHTHITKKRIGMYEVNDYSDGKDSIMKEMEKFMISYTQEEAGFESVIIERFLTCKMNEHTPKLITRLKKDKVIEGESETILADTAVKLMSKVHQLSSGTVKFESGESAVLDYSKAEFIKKEFEGIKIGIFYKFKEEFNALKSIFGDDLTEDVEEFDSTDKSIALQIVSGREGISLRNAEFLVFYNIDHSATSYWQARDRMTTKERKRNIIYWIFSEGGIEWKIYDAVSKKKSYTLSHFKKDFL